MSDYDSDELDPNAGSPGLLPAPFSPYSPSFLPEEDDNGGGEGWRVMLLRSDFSSVDEVVLQIVLATGCPWPHAEEVIRRTCATGRAVVTIGSRIQAERVASVLRRIALRVKVEQV